MRLIFFGTPEFAVPTLARLAAEHELAAVVSQPDRPSGRGRRVQASPVSAFAQGRGLALLRPERVGAPEVVAALRAAAADLGVVVAFGQFLPKSVRELPRLGYLINGHASVLPRHRGAAPIPRAILAGDVETGISVMRVEREMDAGPVALVRTTPIAPDEDAGALGDRLARIAADAIAEALAQIADGFDSWREQDPARATLAPKIGSSELAIDWREPAPAIALRVRAFAPEPGARTLLRGEPLRILAARSEPGAADRAPGTTRVGAGEPLRVATSDGWLIPERVQRAGGNALDIAAYLRGRPISDGEKLGAAERSH
ncbi:MAG TPA: methionyl-tRNA formyltransferase [Myxococcota bacterium]|nr:methionyl-tRNA formyltransferase [Myxococcota bacterium]